MDGFQLDGATTRDSLLFSIKSPGVPDSTLEPRSGFEPRTPWILNRARDQICLICTKNHEEI